MNSLNGLILMVVREDGLDGSVLVVLKLGVLYVPSVVYTVRHLTVMVEEIPLSVILNDRVVCGPSDNGLHDPASVGEGTLGALAGSIYKIMGGSG